MNIIMNASCAEIEKRYWLFIIILELVDKLTSIYIYIYIYIYFLGIGVTTEIRNLFIWRCK